MLAASLLVTGVSSATPVKVAFIGDQGVGEHAQSVLSLIASEGTDLLLIQGDLGYGENAASQWEANLTNALGADFPVLTVVGNHENYEWPEYQRLTQERIDRVQSLSCTGDMGVKAACQFGNIDIVQVSPGIHEVAGVKAEDNYAQYIATSFADSTADWRICSWHKNQESLQTGNKGDATGWDVYDSCLNAGAMVAVAHEHAYSRTYLLSDFRNQTVIHRNSEMALESGSSFAFVSGLGGREVRPQVKSGDWWAAIYTATQGATHGALFCTFEEKTADCYFKAIDGAVPDQFTLVSRLNSSAGTVAVTAQPDTQPETQPDTQTDTPDEQPDVSLSAGPAPSDSAMPVAASPGEASAESARGAEGSVTDPALVDSAGSASFEPAVVSGATNGSTGATDASSGAQATGDSDTTTPMTVVERPAVTSNSTTDPLSALPTGSVQGLEAAVLASPSSYPSPAPPQVDTVASGGGAGSGRPSVFLLVLLAGWWQWRAIRRSADA